MSRINGVEIKPYITIPNPNPGRYGRQRVFKAYLEISKVPGIKGWHACYTTRGEIGVIVGRSGRTVKSALKKLARESNPKKGKGLKYHTGIMTDSALYNTQEEADTKLKEHVAKYGTDGVIPERIKELDL